MAYVIIIDSRVFHYDSYEALKTAFGTESTYLPLTDGNLEITHPLMQHPMTAVFEPIGFAYEVIYWDWKEQPDIAQLNDAIKGVFDGKQVPHLSLVDEGSDQYVLVVSAIELTEGEAQACLREWSECREKEYDAKEAEKKA